VNRQATSRVVLARVCSGFLSALGVLVFLASIAKAQTPSIGADAQTAQAQVSQGQVPVITLEEAIQRAQQSDPAYAAAKAGGKAAALDRTTAWAGILPSAEYHNQGLYTQPNGHSNQAGQVGAQQAPRFIANNAVREYASQLSANETIGLSNVAEIRRAEAVAAQAAAEMEISRRGLVAAVTALFYGTLAADHKVAIAQRAQQEAADFTGLTEKREQARESAHADVVKAQLEEQGRDRELEDARVESEKARLELGVLLFPDPRAAYTLSAPEIAPPLASRDDIDAAAAKNNPELRSALSALDASNADVLAARAAYLPDIAMNVTYGIDAPQFAKYGPGGVQNLGYSASLTLDIPVWDWLSTERRVKQSEIRRESVQVALSATQRQLVAKLDEAYSEAAAARDQLASLDQSVATAAESLRLTKLAYSGGEGTVLDVVDAQIAYVLAQNAREDGRVRYENARANLQTLTGTM
jgi:outer membrane protein TolC